MSAAHESGTNSDEPTFVEVGGWPPLTRAAVQLHAFASLHSIEGGHPGFVDDAYLNAIPAETTTTVFELETAGMWQRRDDGYFVVEDTAIKTGIDLKEKSDQLQADCATRAAHQPSAPAGQDGWIICEHCQIPLQRPDGGPVALPDGGPLES